MISLFFTNLKLYSEKFIANQVQLRIFKIKESYLLHVKFGQETVSTFLAVCVCADALGFKHGTLKCFKEILLPFFISC